MHPPAAAPATLLVTDVFPPRHGGSGRWLWDLYRRLPGLNATVLAGEAPGDGLFDRDSTLHVERFPRRFRSWGLVRGALGYRALAARIAAAIRQHHVTSVHCGKCLPEGLAGLLCELVTGTSYWCYAHGEELTLARSSRELRWLARLVLRRARRVIANSLHTRQLLLEGFGVPEDRIIVLHPGVDTDTFTPVRPDATARAALGWANRHVILTVGALQKRKGQDTLIRALPAVRARHPSVLYAMAGEGWERPYLEQLARDLDVRAAVQFLGSPDESTLLTCYQQCDLFALPNRQVGWDFEGFGIALLEAQACGKPVITGTSGGTRETMRPGVTGELVPCDEPAPLAEACCRLLDDERRRVEMGAAARAWTIERFSWSVVANQAAMLLAD